LNTFRISVPRRSDQVLGKVFPTDATVIDVYHEGDRSFIELETNESTYAVENYFIHMLGKDVKVMLTRRGGGIMKPHSLLKKSEYVCPECQSIYVDVYKTLQDEWRVSCRDCGHNWAIPSPKAEPQHVPEHVESDIFRPEHFPGSRMASQEEVYSDDRYTVRLEYLEGKEAYKYEVYLIDKQTGRSGVVYSSDSDAGARRMADDLIRELKSESKRMAAMNPVDIIWQNCGYIGSIVKRSLSGNDKDAALQKLDEIAEAAKVLSRELFDAQLRLGRYARNRHEVYPGVQEFTTLTVFKATAKKLGYSLEIEPEAHPVQSFHAIDANGEIVGWWDGERGYLANDHDAWIEWTKRGEYFATTKEFPAEYTFGIDYDESMDATFISVCIGVKPGARIGPDEYFTGNIYEFAKHLREEYPKVKDIEINMEAIARDEQSIYFDFLKDIGYRFV